MAFIGRNEELARLGKFLGSSTPAIAAIYGRRRIGKSLLIEQALNGRDALFFDALEDQPKKDQIEHFLFQLHLQTESTLVARGKTPRTWKEAFLRLYKAIERERVPVVLDEFQWLANYRHEIVADLKYVWDRFFSKLPGQKLILCGSIASFMVEKVIKSRALYGRIDTEIELSGFKLAETRQLLTGRGQDEILEAQMLTGGTPKYLQLLAEYPSIQIAMQELSFTRRGYLTMEYQKIFSSHFARHPGFEAIVNALSRHPLGLFRDELARKEKLTAGGQLSAQLRDLESAGFISSEIPFNRDVDSRQIKYFLTDAYLRFYFAFIRPNLKLIRARRSAGLFAEISRSGAYYAWVGRSFEYLCMQHADVIAGIIGFSGIHFTAGPYFAPARAKASGVQVDLVFDRPDNVLTVCELKYSNKPVGVEVIADMKKKLQALQPIAGRKTLQPVLIVRDRASQDLIDTGYFHRIVEVGEILAAG